MNEYELELIKEIRAEALGLNATRIVDICDILLKKETEITPEESWEPTVQLQ
jgi:hypothetical protein